MPPDQRHPDHRLDGCDVDMTVDPTPDDELDLLVLFAGVDSADVERHAAELRELLSP